MAGMWQRKDGVTTNPCSATFVERGSSVTRHPTTAGPGIVTPAALRGPRIAIWNLGPGCCFIFGGGVMLAEPLIFPLYGLPYGRSKIT